MNKDKGLSFARSLFSSIVGNTKLNGKYFPVVNKLLVANAYYKIKTKLSFSELCTAADFLDKNLPFTHKELLYGKPLPKNYADLGNSERLPFFRETEDEYELEYEINWTLISMRKFVFEINLFIAYKKLYEKELLLANYLEAEKYLDKIENEICVSLWSLENRYLLGEFSNSGIQNKEFLTHFNEINKSKKNITKVLSHYLSLRAEKSLSVNRFTSDLNFFLKGIGGEIGDKYIDFYKFKLSYLNNLDYANYDGLLLLDFSHSVIDRYLGLTKVFTNILTISNHNESEEAEIIKKYIKNRIDYLIRKINDPILYKLKLLASTKLFPAFDANESKREIRIIDKYTTGLYSEVQEELSKLLVENPNQFDLYILYVKSLIYQKESFIPIGNTKSIQNTILKNIYSIISASISPKQLGINLLSIANNISGCTLSYGIMDFVYFQTEGKKERELLSRLSYNCANPIISEIYPDELSKLKYLNLLKTKFPDSITIQFFESKFRNIQEFHRFESKIPSAKFKTEQAKRLQKAEKFVAATNIWKELILQYSDTIPIWEVAIRNLYICYENLNLYDECIELYVNSFMKNNYIVEKIETQSLSNKITKNAFRNVNRTINLAIFFTLIGADETITHLAFELFNMELGVFKPSSLFDKFDKFDKQKIIYFLKYTCSAETLRNSPFITNSKERLEERLLISEFLREIDTNDKQFYDNEIKDIRNILIIQKGLMELDESKIYVNEQGIINHELKDYEAIFLRFKSIAEIVQNSNFKMLNIYDGNITTYSYDETDKEVEFSSNPVFDIYLELFNAIKNKFLYSKFGIVTYLSTRIRHGVLIGEIRPVFEKHKLITLKEGNTSEYRKNNHWDRVYYKIPDSKKIQLHNQLNNFSNLIDGLIYDLIKKHLQVHSESNKDGWFNYNFENKDLLHYSLNSLKSKDFNEFTQKVFEVLWEKTDNNLNLIRERIQEDIATKVNSIFNSFEENIVNILGKENSVLLSKAIKDCSTEIQVVIRKVSSWFKRSGSVASDFELSTLIEMVIQQTDKTNRINLNKNLNFNCKIKGKFLTNFADLLRIFIENILKHSDKNAEVLEAKIGTNKSDNYQLKITIENEITNIKSVSELKTTWKENIINLSKLQSENKSGYVKAYKILKDDLGCITSKCLTTSIDDDETKFIVTMNIDSENLFIETVNADLK